MIDQRTERVYLETSRHRVLGTLMLPRDGYRSRVSDYLNGIERDFVSLTDATVELIDHDGPGTIHPVLTVARRHIVLVIPQDPEAETPAPERITGASAA